MSSPLSRCGLAAALCLAVAATSATSAKSASATAADPPAVPGPTATATATTQDALAAAQARLAAANELIVQVAVRLQDGTVRWQAGVDALGVSQTATVQAQRVAEQAAAAAGRSQQALADVVAAQYRMPQLPSALLVFSSGVGSATDALRAVQDLQRVNAGQQKSLADARGLRADAEQAARQAQARRDADSARARSLAAELADLQALAERTNEQVQAASADVERLQAQRDAEIAAEVAAELARQQAAEAARQAQLAAQRVAADQAAQRRSTTTPPSTKPAPSVGPASGDCAGRSTSGYANGNIPASALCPLRYAPGQVLRADAAAAFNQLTEAYRAARGTPICITDSYRDYATQVRLFATKPSLAAVPGTSNHGWGVAVDLCGGIQDYGTPAYTWMKANAPRFGWIHPAWAEPGGNRQEPWHWEYTG